MARPKYQHRRPSENGERGRHQLEHVMIAERVIGKPLPPTAVVHHVDGNGRNNAHSNLVICPNQGYHALLHIRQRALDACGHAHWIKCPFCKSWDEPENMHTYVPGGYRQPRGWHRSCQLAYQRERAAAGFKSKRDGSRGGKRRG